jgi:integrase
VAGEQAKMLNNTNVMVMLRCIATNRCPQRDRVIILLFVKVRLRAHEIAILTWPMVLDACGQIGPTIELYDRAAKRGSGRSIPIQSKLKIALIQLRQTSATGDPVIISERGGKMTANSVINWFGDLYRRLSPPSTACSISMVTRVSPAFSSAAVSWLSNVRSLLMPTLNGQRIRRGRIVVHNVNINPFMA